MTKPPERLENETVVLERARSHHADVVDGVIASSIDELVLWMDWARAEPAPGDDSFVARAEIAWNEATEFAFVMIDPVDHEAIGVTSLMARIGDGGLEIGYWVRSDRTGRGVASAATRLLIDAALDLPGIDRIEIHHDLANVASGRIPEKLGFTEISRTEVEIDNPGEIGTHVIWRLTP